jgi:hypothetical protein
MDMATKKRAKRKNKGVVRSTRWRPGEWKSVESAAQAVDIAPTDLPRRLALHALGIQHMPADVLRQARAALQG